MSGQWPDALKPRTIVFAVVGVLVFVAVERFAKVLYSHAVEPSFKFCAAKCNIGPSHSGHDESAKAGLSLGPLGDRDNKHSSAWSSFFMALCELVFVVAILSIVTYAIVYLSRDTRPSTSKTIQDQTLPAT